LDLFLKNLRKSWKILIFCEFFLKSFEKSWKNLKILNFLRKILRKCYRPATAPGRRRPTSAAEQAELAAGSRLAALDRGGGLKNI